LFTQLEIRNPVDLRPKALDSLPHRRREANYSG
jgi:hypothetical protein